MATPTRPERPLRMIAFMKYGERAASTRQRLLQYLPALAAAGIEVEWHPLMADAWIGRRDRGRFLPAIAAAYLRRLWSLWRARSCDVIWIHKELFPYTPGWVEAMVARLGPAVLYDFDDAIFHNYDRNRRGWVRVLLGRRFERLLGAAAAASCGNNYLRDYAARFCRRAEVIPTTLDADRYVPAAGPRSSAAVPVIGWIGSPSTWEYMAPLVPLLEGLVAAGRAQVLVVGAGKASDGARGFTSRPWREDTEVADVQSMDIGIMPLTDDPWSRGKCGYKLIQYMACGVPVIASPVGVNADLAVPGRTGELATTADDWAAALDKLLADRDLRHRYGRAGRALVEERYSLASQIPRLTTLITDAAGTSGTRV